MMPDKNTARQLLSLSDEELLFTVRKICSDNNIDTSRMNIGIPEMRMLKTVLKNASDSDIERFISYFAGGKKNGH